MRRWAIVLGLILAQYGAMPVQPNLPNGVVPRGLYQGDPGHWMPRCIGGVCGRQFENSYGVPQGAFIPNPPPGAWAGTPQFGPENAGRARGLPYAVPDVGTVAPDVDDRP